MEVLMSITGKDFVMTASDSTIVRSIVVMKTGTDKTIQLTPTCIMVYSGEQGDTTQFSEYIQKNVRLYSIKHSQHLSTKSVASFVRKQLATSLRSRVF